MLRPRTRFLFGLLVGAACAAGVLAALRGDREAGWSVEDRSMAARMHAFSQALVKPPENSDPAPGWKPLLHDGSPDELLCSVCHGESGVAMQQAIADGSLKLDTPNLDVQGRTAVSPDWGQSEMVELMERWTRQLNRHARARLVKAVRCVDCHASDPRE